MLKSGSDVELRVNWIRLEDLMEAVLIYPKGGFVLPLGAVGFVTGGLTNMRKYCWTRLISILGNFKLE